MEAGSFSKLESIVVVVVFQSSWEVDVVRFLSVGVMWRQKKEGEGIFLRKASVEHERRELTPFPRAALALARVRFPLPFLGPTT